MSDYGEKDSEGTKKTPTKFLLEALDPILINELTKWNYYHFNYNREIFEAKLAYSLKLGGWWHTPLAFST